MFDKLKQALGVEWVEQVLSSVFTAYAVRACSEDVRKAMLEHKDRKIN